MLLFRAHIKDWEYNTENPLCGDRYLYYTPEAWAYYGPGCMSSHNSLPLIDLVEFKNKSIATLQKLNLKIITEPVYLKGKIKVKYK